MQTRPYPLSLPSTRQAWMAAAVLMGAVGFATGARAATDISNTPLATTSDITAKPNVMFVLDDSGSMGWEYMPDNMSNSGQYGYRSIQCNGVAYNPAYDYTANRPVQADGTLYPNAPYTAAPLDGFNTGGKNSTTNLSSGTQIYYKYKGTQPRMGWTYKSDGSLDSSTTFVKECRTDTDNSSSVFTKVTVTASSAEAQNYANWYSYYRKRILMMRSASGRAFLPIDAKYRVGFTTINDTSVAGNKFLNVGPFNDNQKEAFYSKLYSIGPNGGTPLRGSLSKVGRYFANKITGQTDPMEYACQRNYTILSSDGYWNNSEEGSSYGPFQLNGSTKVGQQDGAEAKPMWDGANAVATTTTPYSVVKHQRSDLTVTTSTTHRRYSYSTSTSGCSGGRTRLRTQQQRSTHTKKETISSYEDVVGSYTRTVETTNGVVTRDNTSNINWGAPGSPTQVDPLVETNTNTNWANSGSATTSGSCATNTSVPSPNPSATTIVSGPSVSSNTNVVELSRDAAVVSGTPVVVDSTSAGSSNSLADVAQYYWATDLRTPALGNCTGALNSDVCNNEVPITGLDRAEHQHMTTFTLGLGMNGILPYDKDYLNTALQSGSYHDLKNGSRMWPIPPDTSNSGNAANVDDMWHAAVNGRGQYWSASDPGAVAEAISAALSNVTRTIGSSSSAATSSLQPVKGDDNQVFVAKYTTKVWTGDLVAHSLNGDTGNINTDSYLWSATEQLASKSATQRVIYYAQPGATTPALRLFNHANLQSDGLSSLFSNLCSKVLVATQCLTLEDDPKAQANSAANLVDYLRGDDRLSSYSYTSTTGNVNAPVSVSVYRGRESKLGDIINASPVYVSKPPFSYLDEGYAEYKTTHADRAAVVMSAANDGMLHAFAAKAIGNTPAGTELWAFVPSAVMPEMYRLANIDYENHHRFFVDGTPTVGDIRVGTTWKTIVVGGLNSGGKAYYALDVTDPTAPRLLWEFSHANLGLSYGNPIITKRSDGTWVVVVSSGYNNGTGGGDGNGHLFVLNANTGEPVSDLPNGIPTMVGASSPAGTSASPSGLGKINTWIEDNTNNTSGRFYGGDLNGNLWRFDIDNQVAPTGQEAVLLASLKDPSGQPQPITTKPETAWMESASASVVMVATGRYLGLSDIIDTQTQSVYAIKDSLGATGLGNITATRTDIVTQTLSTGDTDATVRTASRNAVDWATKNGWRVDLPSSGERVAVDMQLQYTTLAVVSAIPGSSVCSPSGGSSWLYTFDIANGASVINGGVTGSKLGSFLGVGLTWIVLTDGSSRLIIPGSDAKIVVKEPAVSRKPKCDPTAVGSTCQSGSSAGARRTSWRELVD